MIKVGDKVRCINCVNVEGHLVDFRGEVLRKVRLNCLVGSIDGKTAWFKASELEIFRYEKSLKIGDRVRLTESVKVQGVIVEILGDIRRHLDRFCLVHCIDGMSVWFTESELELIG